MPSPSVQCPQRANQRAVKDGTGICHSFTLHLRRTIWPVAGGVFLWELAFLGRHQGLRTRGLLGAKWPPTPTGTKASFLMDCCTVGLRAAWRWIGQRHEGRQNDMTMRRGLSSQIGLKFARPRIKASAKPFREGAGMDCYFHHRIGQGTGFWEHPLGSGRTTTRVVMPSHAEGGLTPNLAVAVMELSAAARVRRLFEANCFV